MSVKSSRLDVAASIPVARSKIPPKILVARDTENN